MSSQLIRRRWRVMHVVAVVAFDCRGDSITDQQPYARGAQRPTDWLFLEVFPPIESVLYNFVLLGHVFFDLRYRVCDRISCLLHATLKLLLGWLIVSGCAIARAPKS